MVDKYWGLISFLLAYGIVMSGVFYFSKAPKYEWNWKNISKVVFLTLLWLGFSIVVHEWLGHALTNYLLGGKVKQISCGVGPLLTKFSLGETIVKIRLIPLTGKVTHEKLASHFLNFLVIAVGPLVHLLYVYLTYLILLKKVHWRERSFGHFLWWYGIRIGWMMILFMNFPFYRLDSDGTKIFKALLGVFKNAH